MLVSSDVWALSFLQDFQLLSGFVAVRHGLQIHLGVGALDLGSASRHDWLRHKAGSPWKLERRFGQEAKGSQPAMQWIDRKSSWGLEKLMEGIFIGHLWPPPEWKQLLRTQAGLGTNV